jgi:HK97 family phage major capsid protein
VIDLLHSVDPAYRASPKCRFMMHDTVLAAFAS